MLGQVDIFHIPLDIVFLLCQAQVGVLTRLYCIKKTRRHSGWHGRESVSDGSWWFRVACDNVTMSWFCGWCSQASVKIKLLPLLGDFYNHNRELILGAKILSSWTSHLTILISRSQQKRRQPVFTLFYADVNETCKTRARLPRDLGNSQKSDINFNKARDTDSNISISRPAAVGGILKHPFRDTSLKATSHQSGSQELAIFPWTRPLTSVRGLLWERELATPSDTLLHNWQGSRFTVLQKYYVTHMLISEIINTIFASANNCHHNDFLQHGL